MGRHEVALGEVARVDGKRAAVRQPVKAVDPAARASVRVALKRAAFVGHQMAADAAALARSGAAAETRADIAWAEDVQQEAPDNAPKENQADAARLRGKRKALCGQTHDENKNRRTTGERPL